MSDKILPSYDADGNVMGVMDLGFVMEQPKNVMRGLVNCADWDDRWETVAAVNANIPFRETDHDLTVATLASVIAELMQHLDVLTEAMDSLSDLDSKAKLREIYNAMEAA